MGLYKLSNTEHDIEDGVARKIKPDSIDYEKYFESWLENTPSMLLDDDESTNTVLWIGRQVSASVGDSEKFPDMIGIDSSGDLVIVELKKVGHREILLHKYSNMLHGVLYLVTMI
ncbi:hypothetical protein [Romboutsia lituseburensis]|uniref:hypothetical protein n=1 Tax=Romboutsia lituseburensis TaxID=1537 RepID=UPI0022EB62BF|nr:hypothetical protein [Romboutsia lituseburensis]